MTSFEYHMRAFMNVKIYKYITVLIPLFLIHFSCIENGLSEEGISKMDLKSGEITCTDSSCFGAYTGPEFVKGSDVAHQFSNTMSAKVGAQLKLMYKEKKFSKVNFSKIEMTTKGMGTGTVTYFLKVPFKRVQQACDAYTSFDHCGGWNHSPAIEARKRQLQKALLLEDSLDVSPLLITKEGLQEYWIQWRNKLVQNGCQ